MGEGEEKLTATPAGEDKVVVFASALSPHDKALLKFGENLVVGSLDTIKDFAKTMITLVSGMFAVYFAILKFLGAEDVTKIGSKAIVGIVDVPPMLFVVSIIAFVLGVLPIYLRLSLNDPSSIRKVRLTLVGVKYAAVSAGVILFLLGMYFMSIISLRILFG